MARITARLKELSEDDIAALVDIGVRKAALVDRLEEALLKGDVEAVFAAAWRVVGNEKEALKVGNEPNPKTQRRKVRP